MRALRWLVLVAVGLVLAEEAEKDMEAITWYGGKTQYPSGPHFNGLSTRCQIIDHYAFIAIPKLKPEVRSTVCKLDMTRKIESSDHIITPFPENEPTDPQDDTKMQSVVDLTVDHFHILWCLDVGAIYPPKHENERPKVCPPKVVALDSTTGKELHSINLLQYVASVSRLQFILADYSHAGRPYIYVCDAATKAIIVCDVDANKCHRAELPSGVINDYQPRDVLYMVLIRKASGHNKIYFTYRSAETLWCIESQHLQEDKTMAKAYEVGKKPSKMIILGTDDWDCMYFRYEKDPKVFKWNSSTPFDEKNFQLVHKTSGDLIPTHACADYKNGVMRLSMCNLLDYLKPETPAEKSTNSLVVMAVDGHSEL